MTKRDIIGILRMSLLVIVLGSPIYSQSRVALEPADCNTYAGPCGDIDANELISVSDVVYLINYIFAGGPEPAQMWTADADFNQIVNISDGVFLINFIFAGGPEPCPWLPKRDFTDLTSFPSPFLDCIQFSYDGVGTLTIRHTNAAFNCCPIAVSFETSVVDQTITVTEGEEYGPGSPCSCLCLSDVDIPAISVAPGIYTIFIDEMNVFPESPRLELVADLTEATTGGICVFRDYYPWLPMWWKK